MKIELKNIRHSPSLSEETEAFTANLYIKSKHVGIAKNQGHGGNTDYQAISDAGKKLIKEAEEYCKQLPPEKHSHADGAYTLDITLETYIDNLLFNHLQEKELQKFRSKIDKAAEMGIVFGVADRSFQVLRLKMPVGTLLVHPNGHERLTEVIAKKVLPELAGDIQILNTNIPETVLKAAGLKEQQYLQPQDITVNQKKTKARGKRL